MYTTELAEELENNEKLKDEFVIFHICIPTAVAHGLHHLAIKKGYEPDGYITQALIHYLEAWRIEGNWDEYKDEEVIPPQPPEAEQLRMFGDIDAA